MTLRIIKDKEVWDNFVNESPYGYLFHKWDFLNTMEKYSKFNLRTYGIFNRDELIAIFPLFFEKMWGLKMVFSPPPHAGVPYLGFVVNKNYDDLKQNKKEGILNLIADEIDEEIKDFNSNYLSFSLIPNFLDIRSFKWKGYETRNNFSYVIDLRKNLDEIYDGFTKTCRKQIKKAESNNLSYLKSDDISIFYNMLVERYKEQGINVPIFNKKYLLDLFKLYPKNLGLYYIHDYEGEIIGAIVTQEYKRFILWMGNSRIIDNIYGNEYIIWNLIKKAKLENYYELKIFGANLKRLCKFKSKFNPSLEIALVVYKKDILGKIVERAYYSIIRKRFF
jgi:hypothetical protein